MQIQRREIGIFILLVVLMAATRLYGHFGTAATLPDASLAVFFLTGLYLARLAGPAVLAFIFLLLEAAGVDYYAVTFAGVSGACISPAYWFLIPAYACMWYGGRWFAMRQQMNWRSLGLYAAVAWAATTASFLISDVSFYLLSGKASNLGVAQYIESDAKYYVLYLLCTLFYLACAALLYMLALAGKEGTASSNAQNG